MAGISGKCAERCPRGDQRREEEKDKSYKSSYNRESSGRSVNRNPLRNIGGADRDRTDDLLNAIIPNLSRASYSSECLLLECQK